MMFVTKSIVLNATAAAEDNLRDSDEGTVQWIFLENLKEKNFQIFKDIPLLLEKVLDDDGLFTAASEFNGEGELLSLTFR